MLTSLINRPLEIINRTRDEYLHTAFFTVLLTYTVLLVDQSLTYGSNARLFPSIVGGLLIVLLIIRITLIFLGSNFDIQEGALFSELPDPGQQRGTDGDHIDRYTREAKTILWVAGLWAGIQTVGFFYTLLAFFATYSYLHGRNLRRAIATSIIYMIIIHFLFVEFLEVPLWGGV